MTDYHQELDSPWVGPPLHLLGTPIELGLVLFRIEDTVRCVATEFVAYPTGFHFVISMRRRLPSVEADAWFRALRPNRDASSAPGGRFRFRLTFADGTSVNNGGPMLPPDEPPQGPLLVTHRGAGGANQLRAEGAFWVWPLPPPGPARFVSSWEAGGIRDAETLWNTRDLVEAAVRSQALWSPSGA